MNCCLRIHADMCETAAALDNSQGCFVFESTLLSPLSVGALFPFCSASLFKCCSNSFLCFVTIKVKIAFFDRWIKCQLNNLKILLNTVFLSDSRLKILCPEPHYLKQKLEKELKLDFTQGCSKYPSLTACNWRFLHINPLSPQCSLYVPPLTEAFSSSSTF